MRKIEEADEKGLSGRTQICCASKRLIRNSQDLLTALNTAQKMGGWQDALQAAQEGIDAKITLNVAHVSVLTRACVSSGKVDAVEALLKSEALEGDSATEIVTMVTGQVAANAGWQRAIEMVHALPSQRQSTASYNECVQWCARSGEWEAAMSIVASMGPANVVCTGNPPLEGDPRITRPPPDAVTYASLISVLQENGKREAAQDILLKLPPQTRELIMTSIMALINVWSEQRFRKQK